MTQNGATGPRRKLQVDLKGLQAAFDDTSFETHYFLDRNTGVVVLVTGLIRRQLESIYDELYRADNHSLSHFESALRRRNLGEETGQALRTAHQVECALGGRYIPLPPAHPHMEVRDMEDYIATLQDAELRQALWDALRNHDPQGRFMEVLSQYPDLPARWHAFHVEQVLRRLHHWLDEEGIEPIESPRFVDAPV
ncbi:MAG: UPF0158 family protein [Anaerolineae bacterium]